MNDKNIQLFSGYMAEINKISMQNATLLSGLVRDSSCTESEKTCAISEIHRDLERINDATGKMLSLYLTKNN